MVAAAQGRLDILEFLLQSAVYSERTETDIDSGQDNDANPGGQDQACCLTKDMGRRYVSKDTGIFTADSPDEGSVFDLSGSSSSSVLAASSYPSYESHMETVVRFVLDTDAPKGKSIFHGKYIALLYIYSRRQKKVHTSLNCRKIKSNKDRNNLKTGNKARIH